MDSANTLHWKRDIDFDESTRSFRYAEGVSGPPAEVRGLEDIRDAFRDPTATGPDWLYAIAMDVYRMEHRTILEEAMILLGVVAYNRGRVGYEPVRSQGHVHRVSSHSGWSPPEIFEIWQGRAIVVMQETAEADAGTCYAVTAGPGDKVIVPPGWPHMVANASVDETMVFGAVCDRAYDGFEYDRLRIRGGLAYLPVFDASGVIHWQRNENYRSARLVEKRPSLYAGCTALPDGSAYRTMCEDPGRFACVPWPGRCREAWEQFVP